MEVLKTNYEELKKKHEQLTDVYTTYKGQKHKVSNAIQTDQVIMVKCKQLAMWSNSNEYTGSNEPCTVGVKKK